MLLSLHKCEKEKDVLLTPGEDIATIGTSHDLVALINEKLKELLPFNRIELVSGADQPVIFDLEELVATSEVRIYSLVL